MVSNLPVRNQLAAAFLSVGLLVGAGCSRPARRSAALWIVKEQPVFQEVPPGWVPAADSGAGSTQVELTGAINETVSFRFAVRVGSEPIVDPQLRFAPFSSAGARVAPVGAKVFRLQPVLLNDYPGWHIRSLPPDKRAAKPLDVLVPVDAPRGGLPSILGRGRTDHFWVDITIPKGTFEGTYVSRLALQSAGITFGSIAIRLKVWPIILPDESDIPTIVELDHRALFAQHVQKDGQGVALTIDDWRDARRHRSMDSLLFSTLRLLQAHRLTPVLHKLSPVVKLDAQGEFTIDWGQYDAVVKPCMNGSLFGNRVPSSLWPMPSYSLFSSLRDRETESSVGYLELLRRYLKACADHFARMGWLDRSYFLLPSRGVTPPGSNPAPDDLIAMARKADERIVVASQGWPQEMGPYGWVDYPSNEPRPSVDVWLPPAQFYDVESMAQERAAGRRTWLAVDRPPYSGSVSVYAPSSYQRVLSWQADQLGAEALYLGCINRWPRGVDQPTPTDCVRADPHVLIYPGRPFGLNEPVASVRLKYLRQSLQDAALRKLLNEHDLDHVTATLARSLAPYAASHAYRTHFADGRPIGWIADETMFDLARNIMAAEFIKSAYGVQGVTRPEAFVRTAAWRRFMFTTRKLHLFVDGTRLRLRGGHNGWEADVESSLTIMNRSRGPVEGTVRFTDLPEGWSTDDGGQKVAPIPPNRSRRMTLTAQATGQPSWENGLLTLPVELTTGDGVRYRHDMRLACVTAVPFQGSLRIDGDFSDWPPGAANVASNFRLIAAEQNDRPGPSEEGPRHATLAFVMRDDEYLYIAINSEFDGQHALPRLQRNRVRYDDLVPVGEELVEVLIDPLNAGTRTPADLYHIVVKPSGAYLSEKGIRFEPPCCRRDAWPVDMEVATRIGKGRWTAELRIPLSSFDVDETRHTIWGMNITRYDAARQEFSTWSGASGNAYDPLSLGNLYLP